MSDDTAYTLLISSCADALPEPVCGKPGVEKLPQLKPDEIALVCRVQEVDVTDQFVEVLNLTQLAVDIEAQDFARLGARVALLLERACRAAIAYDVMCELERREHHDAMERDLAEWQRFSGIRTAG